MPHTSSHETCLPLATLVLKIQVDEQGNVVQGGSTCGWQMLRALTLLGSPSLELLPTHSGWHLHAECRAWLDQRMPTQVH